MHTPLCRHASGEPTEYAAQAVALGLGEIGFSDHSPMRADDFDHWRMRFDQLDEYVDKVRRAQQDHPNLIVSRTFSKIYGMAGLRCGYCVAQKETVERMRQQQMWDSVNCMALAAAIASLDDPDHVPNGQRLNKEAKQFTTSELEKMGYKIIPSQANFIMFDCKKPVVPLIKAMKERNVHVGRLFPALPNHMRLTIGKKSEMETFLLAFREVAA